MTIADLLAMVVALLDRAGVPHMLAGSAASSFHGEPRATQDLDLVIDPSPEALTAFVAALDPERFYVGDAVRALARRDQFNVIDVTTGWKVDLIIRKGRPFSREEFARRLPVEVLGVHTAVATAEDTVLAKLERARAGGSERQQADVVSVLRVAGPLDDAYLDRWAAELDLAAELDQAWRDAAGR